MSELMFPKTGIKKKRKKHRESILQKKDGECFLCAIEGDHQIHLCLHRHHIFGGANREKSEEYGLTVYLCPDCHLYGERAAHINKETAALLHKIGQQAFEKTYPDKNFREIFGKNYIWH